ncbi:MAG TPA: RNA methyltransferase [Actinobacteria bacterium]|nr:RNA methyltransferase [Actinomycetota bacterium]
MLTSTKAPKVAKARELSRRRERTQQRLFLAEGPQAVREALRRTGTVVELFLTPQAQEREPALAEMARRQGVALNLCTEAVAGALAQTVTPQGVVAVCRHLDVDLAVAVGASTQLVAVLAEVRDPGNAGAVVRCADAAGCDAVALTGDAVDLYNPKVVRASAGSAFHVPICVGTRTQEFIAHARGAGLRVVAADATGDLLLDDATDSGFLSAPTAWIFGNEAHGLSKEIRDLCDAVIAVPIHGRAESLNLATAAAVCLYASARAQRRELPSRQ